MTNKLEFIDTLHNILNRSLEVQTTFSNFENDEDELIYNDMSMIIRGVNRLLREIEIGSFNIVFEEK